MQSKSSDAALVAQALASQRSWANEFVPTPTRTSTRQPVAANMISPTTGGQQIPDGNPPAYEDIANDRPTELPAELPAEVPRNNSRSLPLRELDLSKPTDRASLVEQLDPARSHVRAEKHGSISGVFTLFDYLDLTTEYGSITITVDPRPGNVPIILRLTATHGAIHVKLSDEYVQRLNESGKLDRPWDVRIRAKFGAVDAQLPIGLGSRHFLKSRWGAVASSFVVAEPGQDDTVSDVQVETHNGAQSVTFKPSQKDIPMTNVSGDYHAKANGSIKVVYPSTWEGRILAKSSRGKVKVEGNNLELQEYGSKETHASRGVARQTTLIRCDGSGKVKVEC